MWGRIVVIISVFSVLISPLVVGSWSSEIGAPRTDEAASAAGNTASVLSRPHNCHGKFKHVRHKWGVRVNMTTFGENSLQPVLIISTLARGVREWDSFARILCETKKLSVVIVHIPAVEIWRALVMIEEARVAMICEKPAILFAKRTGAVYVVKYGIKAGFDSIKKAGLVAPNITDIGDVWTLSALKTRLVLFWNTDDHTVDFLEQSKLWETTVAPPLVTVQDKQRPLSHQLFPSMLKFATSEPVMDEYYGFPRPI